MTFVSYAQNFEDVMLWRALKHIEHGFYIDVGANDPIADSVTKAFYDRGWHGINIEPLPSHYADLAEVRTRDINLQCAAGDEAGEVDIWEFDIRGWATASPDVVLQHKINGHEGVIHQVPVLQLKTICASHVNGEIHFLKIDVEGFEKSVINGMDFSRFRPWILVIEATKPNSMSEVHWEWEGGILSADYEMAYSDGLNRFYVAKEHPELMGAFCYPPNVFDDYKLAAQQSLEEQLRQSELNAQKSEIKAQQAEEATQQYIMELQSVYASRSWRLTSPVRKFMNFICKRK